MKEDTLLIPDPTPEEIAAAEHDAELARRIRREIVRVQSGEADEELKQDEEERREQYEREAREKEAERRRESNIIWLLFTGNILTRAGITKYYREMIIIAALFFVSIFVMFWSLHLDMRYSHLARETQLMRERSVRIGQQCTKQASYTEVVKAVERRGLNLVEPKRPAIVSERGGWLDRYKSDNINLF